MLFLLPLGVSVVLSLFFLFDEGPPPIAKVAVVCWTGLSILLQFLVPIHFLVPLVMQIVASFALLAWCKANEMF